MEKLIELVYEYNKDPKDYGLGLATKMEDSEWHELKIDKEAEIIKYKNSIIAKDYGFIERLFEKDHIDRRTLKSVYDISYHSYTDGVVGHEEKYSDEESLIMLLSISDDPLRDLNSKLKP